MNNRLLPQQFNQEASAGQDGSIIDRRDRHGLFSIMKNVDVSGKARTV